MAFFGLFGGKKEAPSEAFKRRRAAAGQDPTGPHKLDLTREGQVNLDGYTETAATSALLERHAARTNFNTEKTPKLSTVTITPEAQRESERKGSKVYADSGNPANGFVTPLTQDGKIPVAEGELKVVNKVDLTEAAYEKFRAQVIGNEEMDSAARMAALDALIPDNIDRPPRKETKVLSDIPGLDITPK